MIGCCFASLAASSGNCGSFPLSVSILIGELHLIRAVPSACLPRSGCRLLTIHIQHFLGAACTPIYFGTQALLARLRVDDPVGTVASHCTPAVFGLLVTGVIDSEEGLVATGSLRQLGVQCVGVLALTTFYVGATLPLLLVMERTCGLRVTVIEELTGLDLTGE